MRRFFKLAGGLGLVLALGTGVASAQLGEIIVGKVDFDTPSVNAPSPFTCADGLECLAYERVYGDLDPSLVNQFGVATPPSTTNDGYPRFLIGTSRWNGDGFSTANYPGINALTQACEAWYGIWVAAVDIGTPNYISYYAGESTIVNVSEDGQPNQPSCSAANVQPVACLGENRSAAATFPNTPQGSVGLVGTGWEPVPIPTITNSSVAAGTVDLFWPDVSNVNTPNRPSSIGTACPFGSTFDDLTVLNGPNPVHGVRLFVYKLVPGAPGAARSLDSLEGATIDARGGLDILDNTQNARIACTGAADCPNVHELRCSDVSGGSCTASGRDFLPVGQNIQVSQATVNAALGPDLVSGEAVVFLTKVVFRGAVTGSHAKSGVTNVNPSLVSLFSANSTQVSFSGLVASAAFESSKLIGTRFIVLTWSTVGDVRSFRLERSFNGLDFQEIAEFDATPGQDVYQFTDNLARTRGRVRQITYRLIYELSPGNFAQTFFTVDTVASRDDRLRGRIRRR